MELAGKEISFFSIGQIRDNKEFRIAARKLERFILKQNNALATYRLAIQLSSRGFSTKRLERKVIAIADPKWLVRFAQNIPRCSTGLIEQSLLKLDCEPFHLAMFAISVSGANKELLERLVIKSGNPKAAYICLRYLRHPNIHALKRVIIASKKPRYLFALAERLKRKKDIALIEDLIVESGNATYQRLFAKRIKGSNVLRLEEAVIETGSIKQIKRFAIELGTTRALRLSILD
jgi:hypothetical protein